MGIENHRKNHEVKPATDKCTTSRPLDWKELSHDNSNALRDKEKLGMQRDRSAFLKEIDKRVRENFRGCLRSIVERNRREGEYRSTAPDLRNMTEGQMLLEILSWPDWSEHLQREDIKVNKPILQLIHQMLLDRTNGPKPSDFNPAVRNFNDALDKFQDKEFAEKLRIEPIGFQGGIFFRYHQDSQEYQGRFITLVDPEGNTRTYNQGEDADRIADLTSHVIKGYKRRSGQNEYTKGEALTGDEVIQLKEGESIHGWTCLRHEYVSLPDRVYYTDEDTPLDAVDLSGYEPWSRQTHDAVFPPPEFETLGDPTPISNCAADLFIDGEAWLIYARMRQGESGETLIRTILRENGYYSVKEEDAKVGDSVYYCRLRDINIDDIDVADLVPNYLDNMVVKHVGKVIAINPMKVRSKSGEAAPTSHDLRAPRIVGSYGIPIICRTDRPGGDKLLTAEEWQAKQPT